ncbi:TetR family transcriptional regulator [Glycomyces terrestris]|uniref:TetR family transcriptional regulator n=2 Tax=Glycomyces terrestris TaxID=2493553 RepID=A0A426UZ24_9ACTN|nr:TetR family transcriptional regulator [Glycomyces terrestris]
MHRIQEAALDLFEEQGFDAVAIEAVAAAAEVSPRTVYRYFGTKEMLVIWDEADEFPVSPLAAEFAVADPIGMLRGTFRAAFAAMDEAQLRLIRRRVALIYRTPAIEAAYLLHSYEKSRAIAAAVGPASGDAFGTEVFVHAFVGAVVGAMRHWCHSGFATPPFTFVDQALTLLEHGFGKRAAP